VSQAEGAPYAELPVLDPPRSSSWRGVVAWAFGILLLLDIAALLFVLSLRT
jgi:hypothetical protein